MTDSRPLDVIIGPASAEPCCLPGFCAFSPQAVRFYRSLRRWCRESGIEPSEGAYSFVHAGAHDALARVLGGERGCSTETTQQRWADRILDVERAERAGCRSDEQVAHFLCPFAVEASDGGEDGHPGVRHPVAGRGSDVRQRPGAAEGDR